MCVCPRACVAMLCCRLRRVSVERFLFCIFALIREHAELVIEQINYNKKFITLCN